MGVRVGGRVRGRVEGSGSEEVGGSGSEGGRKWE